MPQDAAPAVAPAAAPAAAAPSAVATTLQHLQPQPYVQQPGAVVPYQPPQPQGVRWTQVRAGVTARVRSHGSTFHRCCSSTAPLELLLLSHNWLHSLPLGQRFSAGCAPPSAPHPCAPSPPPACRSCWVPASWPPPLMLQRAWCGRTWRAPTTRCARAGRADQAGACCASPCCVRSTGAGRRGTAVCSKACAVIAPALYSLLPSPTYCWLRSGAARCARRRAPAASTAAARRRAARRCRLMPLVPWQKPSRCGLLQRQKGREGAIAACRGG